MVTMEVTMVTQDTTTKKNMPVDQIITTLMVYMGTITNTKAKVSPNFIM